MLRSLTLGAAVSLGALYLALRNVPLGDLADYLGAVDYRYLGLSLAVTLVFLAAKAWRWQIILQARYPVRLAQAYHPMIIGFMLNCVLPARVGELARPAVLNRRQGIPFTAGLATVAVERLMDMLTLLAMLAWVLATLDLASGRDVQFAGRRLDAGLIVDAGRATLGLAVVLLALVLAVSRPAGRDRLASLLGRLPRLLPDRLAHRRDGFERRVSAPLIRLLDHVAAGLALVGQPRRLAACAALSAGIWVLAAASFRILALGFPGIDLGLTHMAAVLVIISFCIALPSVPGWWGLWEAGGVFGLSLFGIAAEPAAGFTLVNHALQLFPVIVLGLASALITGVRLGRFARGGAGFEKTGK